MGKRLEEELTYKASLPLVGPFGALCFALLCLSRAFEGERWSQCSGVLLLGTAGLAARSPLPPQKHQRKPERPLVKGQRAPGLGLPSGSGVLSDLRAEGSPSSPTKGRELSSVGLRAIDD